MTLIEGVGEEVTDFFIIVGILLISWIAWCSTNISDEPLIRTVLILQQHTRNRIADFRSNQTVGAVNNNSEINSELSSRINASNVNENGNSCPDSSNNAQPSASADPILNQETPASSGSEQATEIASNSDQPEQFISPEERLIQTMDSTTVNDSRTLLEDNLQQSNSEINNSNVEENNLIEQDNENTNDTLQIEDDKISIKLKFMNDEQKLVTASPKEILGDFKKRHFQMELESRKIVRLVFKGQILQPDTVTLERCGLYNNCVVHCLVHQPRTSTSNISQTPVDNSSTLYFNPQNMPAGTGLSTNQQDWDFSKVFLGVLILILGLAWCTRYYYAQHYNVTSTIVLYALTTIFIVSVLSHFFPDEEGLWNIE